MDYALKKLICTSAFIFFLVLPLISRAQKGVPVIAHDPSIVSHFSSDNLAAKDSIITKFSAGYGDPYIRNTLTQETFANLAIRDFNRYLALFPYAWTQDSRLHIRAGRSDETGYLVNGLSLSDPRDNSFSGYLIPEAIEEISMLPGAYSARYGLANSGLVMTKIRSGSGELNFSLDIHSDKFAGEGEKFLNTYSYQDRYIVAQGEGPLYWQNLRFYAALEFSDIGDAAKRFSQAFYFPGVIDGNPASPAVYTGNPDTVDLVYPDGFTPDNSQSRWALNTKFDLALDPVYLELITLYDQLEAYDSNIPMLDLLNSRKFFTKSQRMLMQGSLRHKLSPDTEYKINAAWFSSESESHDDITGNNWLAWSDTALVNQVTGSSSDFDSHSSLRYPRYRFHGLDFYQNGALTSDYYHTADKYFLLTAAIEHQLNGNHRLYAGMDYRSYQLRYYQNSPNAGYTIRERVEDSYFDPQDYMQEYVENVYGYDLFGNKTDGGANPAREPEFLAFYVEDKIRTDPVSFSIGLRLDRFFTDDRVLSNPANPRVAYNEYRPAIAQDEWQEQEAKWYLSPRIGVMVDAGDATVLQAGYNQLVQPPPLNNSYYADFIYDKQLVRGGFYYTNPIGFDLAPVKSELIDLSISHVFKKQLKLSAVLFYKRTSGQVQVVKQPADSFSDILDYFRMSNGGKSEIRGIDLNFELARTKRIAFFLNYTYNHTNANGSNETSNYATLYRSFWSEANNDVTGLYPLDFVPAQKISMDVDYRFANQDGGPVLQNLGLNLLLTADSGHPYTAAWVPPGG